MDLSQFSRSSAMVDNSAMFDEMLSGDGVSARSSRCAFCKGSKLLCGKDRCPVLARFYSANRMRSRTDRLDLDGASPPSVFVGQFGYPKVSIGPMIPPFHGDTSLLDTPERWVGLPIDDIIEFRSSMVRGMHPVEVYDVESSDRLVERTRELALAGRPPETFAEFTKKPQGRLTVDGDAEPFGPSAPLRKFDISNVRLTRGSRRRSTTRISSPRMRSSPCTTTAP